MRVISIDVSKDSVLNPPIDRRNEVYKWGLTEKDNQLPSIVQHLANESVTAKSCISWVLNAIIGAGFEAGTTRIHPDGTTLNQLQRSLARELATQSNAFLHIGYNANLDPCKMRVITSKKVRIGKSDDIEYSGKFCVANWESKRISPDDIELIDRFNPKKAVVASQIEHAGDISKYKGQILHISKDSSYKYAPSDLYPVLEDAELEKLSKVFRRNGAKYGYLNSKAVIVGKMTEGEETEFKKSLESMQGADNASNTLVFQASQAGVELEKQMVVKDLSTNLNDKVLNYSDEASENAICKSFRVPVSLVSSRSEGIFGNSGELFREMKRQIYEGREYERMLIEEAVNDILKRGDFDIKETAIIDPFIHDPDDVNNK